MCWATFWALFSQAHLVTLVPNNFFAEPKKKSNPSVPSLSRPRCTLFVRIDQFSSNRTVACSTLHAFCSNRSRIDFVQINTCSNLNAFCSNRAVFIESNSGLFNFAHFLFESIKISSNQIVAQKHLFCFCSNFGFCSNLNTFCSNGSSFHRIVNCSNKRSF
jgi:hypothetical protein